MVIAVTKCDRGTFNPDDAMKRISNQLIEYNITTEILGGNVMIIPVGSIKHTGFDDLFTAIDVQTVDIDRKCDDDVYYIIF